MDRYFKSAIELLLLARNIRGDGGYPLPPSRIRDIRKGLRLTQGQFSDKFGFDLNSVQSWEVGRRRPDPISSVLLDLIEREPDAISALVKKVEDVSNPLDELRRLESGQLVDVD